MNGVRIHLFGRFYIECAGCAVWTPETSKARELLCYLILHRDKPQSRESLADRLWPDLPAAQSKKHLRQALYHLNQILNASLLCRDDPALLISVQWVQLDPRLDLWIDLVAFERGLARVQGLSGRQLDADQMEALARAVVLYEGELLEGCYEDWCLFEKERLHNLYLSGLDKLMDYCEAHEAFEAALDYGVQILRYEHARESTHRRMMRLYYRAGDRVAALRQYEHCVQMLQLELAVKPSPSTVALFEQIQNGHLPVSDDGAHILECLKRVQTTLAELQLDIQREVLSLTVHQSV